MSDKLTVLEPSVSESREFHEDRLAQLLENPETQSLESPSCQDGGFTQMTVAHWKIQTGDTAPVCSKSGRNPILDSNLLILQRELIEGETRFLWRWRQKFPI